MRISQSGVLASLSGVLLFAASTPGLAVDPARDPGVRGGPPSAGIPLADLATYEQEYFDAGRDEFSENEGIGDGLGPRFNLDGCAGCHSQPAIGGTAPAVNPQVTVATAFGAHNLLPSFITANGPIREARFKFLRDGSRDGGVHALFVISGRVDPTGDASDCDIAQDNFAAHVARDNVAFRIPTPVFGAGLLEQIADVTIVNNLAAFPGPKSRLGIGGRVNRNGNDGTITRFGWKAQNKSLMIFSGEAYNVEMGITNELFQNERDETARCQKAAHPNTVTNLNGAGGVETESAVGKFSLFMRFLAPPTRSSDTPGGSASIGRGRQLFANIGCAYCHSPTLRTATSSVPALSEKNADLFSDLAVHRMGPRLADNIQQGNAAGDEFRTAPLWGLGQRVFFLHDGRTANLAQALRAHASDGNIQFGPSEANRVIGNYFQLPESAKQDLLNFLRSL